MSRTRIRLLRASVVGGLVLVAIGCGLADYEEQMKAAQEQVARYDQESAYLGDPVAVPKKKTKGKDGKTETLTPIENIFFRAPKGIRTSPDEKEGAKGGLAYHYPYAGAPAAPASKAIGAANANAGLGVTDVYLAVGTDSAEGFADKVAALFPRQGDIVKASRPPIHVPGRPTMLVFVTREFLDSTNGAWSVNVLPFGKTAVAVVYRYEKDKKVSLALPLELSLASLTVGPEANTVKTSYARRPKPAGAMAPVQAGGAPGSGGGVAPGGAAPILRGGSG